MFTFMSSVCSSKCVLFYVFQFPPEIFAGNFEKTKKKESTMYKQQTDKNSRNFLAAHHAPT